jgi:hypothetical protein
MEVDETPLFPLSSVLFPGGSLQLRIFEPRYLDMVGHCLKTNARFGVVAIRSGSEIGPAEFHAFGTLARISDWFEEAPGILGLTAFGTRRFEVTNVRRQRDGLYVGTVADRPREGPARLAEQHAWAARLVETLLARIPHAFDVSPRNLGDAHWVSFRLADILPLAVETKQALLETDDPHARLERLAELAVKIGDSQH